MLRVNFLNISKSINVNNFTIKIIELYTKKILLAERDEQ